MAATVTDNTTESRWEAHVDGELAGFAAYRLHDDHVTFTHTEVDDAFEGQGVGSALARGALEGAKAAGLDVYPACPFIASYIDRHRDAYLGLVPEERREKFGL